MSSLNLMMLDSLHLKHQEMSRQTNKKENQFFRKLISQDMVLH